MQNMSTRTVWCDCENRKVPASECDGCDDYGDLDLDNDWHDDPPLYPVGKLAGMSLEDLERELERQADRQGRLGDAEYIDDRAVEDTEARYRLVETEIKKRKAA